MIGAFIDEKLTGPGELKTQDMAYSGEFKDGKFSGKGTITWTSPDNRSLKYQGTTDGTQFLTGKFEVKLNDQVVQVMDGQFNIPFPVSNETMISLEMSPMTDATESDVPEETKEAIVAPVKSTAQK